MLSSVKVESVVKGDPRDPSLHPRPYQANDARILTVAETGFSMLNLYTNHVDRPFAPRENQESLERFANTINSSGHAEYLPGQRLAAVPRKFFRDLAESTSPEQLQEFKDVIKAFFLDHASDFAARNLFVDFRVGPDPVPQRYIDATVEVLNELPQYAAVRRVMFFTNHPE